MTSLAEVTAALRKKDAERTAIIESIRLLEEAKEGGFIANLQLAIVDIPGVDISAEADIKLSISPEDAGVKASEKKQEVTFNLRSKDVVVNIEVTITPVASVGEEDSEPQPPATFTTQLGVNELGDADSSKIEVVGTSADGQEKSFSIKISFEDVEAALVEKAKAKEEVQQQITELGVAVKEASKQSQTKGSAATSSAKPTASGAGKPLKKKSKKGGVAFADAAAEEEEQSSPSLTERVVQGTQIAFGLALHNRAYIMFALGAAAIYAYGDLASI